MKEISGVALLIARTGGLRCPINKPPTTEAEAKEAVDDMMGVYTRGFIKAWSPVGPIWDHEEYHYLEWRTMGNHYWPKTEIAIEKLTVNYSSHPNDATTAVNEMKADAGLKIYAYKAKCLEYWGTLADNASSRPYAKQQESLAPAILAVQKLAKEKGWNTVDQTTPPTPSSANPCYQPWKPYSP